VKTVFVDPLQCIGCRQCEFACAVEHSKSKEPFLAIFEDPPPRPRIHVEVGPYQGSSFPNKCRHCNPAPCQQICPTGAISRSDDIVLVDIEKCIACAMCAMVCPFDTITFHVQTTRVVATKCDGCFDRVQHGLDPACVEACKVDALVYGELNEIIREGRSRQAILAVNASAGEAPREKDPLEDWREWGREVAQVAGGV
jgi:carbon-monoxide dehydrogenase iron sulfur subunit